MTSAPLPYSASADRPTSISPLTFKTLATIMAVAMVCMAHQVNAQTTARVANEPTITLAFAQQLAAAAIKDCADRGAAVGVVVVDASGGVKIALRADTARPHVVDFAQRKAYTSAMLRYDTERLVENWWAQRGGPGLLNPPGMIALRGGHPIVVNSEVIGGIGVAGGRGGPEDSACVMAAFQAAGIAPPPASGAASTPKTTPKPTPQPTP